MLGQLKLKLFVLFFLPNGVATQPNELEPRVLVAQPAELEQISFWFSICGCILCVLLHDSPITSNHVMVVWRAFLLSASFYVQLHTSQGYPNPH